MRNLMRLPGLGPATALAASLLLSGCAVMRIDVDVYKGPLANDEIVQLQQFQSMAPGMFEVMVQLRDQFEWGDLPVWQCEDGGQMRFQVKTNFGAEKESFEDCPKGYRRSAMASHKSFTHPKAVQVNEILTLFEDRQQGEAAELARSVGNVVAKFRTALNTYDPRPDDGQRWTLLERKMLSQGEFLKRAKFDPAKSIAVSTAFGKFKTRFQRLLDPKGAPCPTSTGKCNWRTINFYLESDDDRRSEYFKDNQIGEHRGIAEAYAELRESLGLDAIEHPWKGASDNVRFQEITSHIPHNLSDQTASSLFFRATGKGAMDSSASKRWIDHYADLLYGVGHRNEIQKLIGAPDEKEAFTAAATNIANAYGDARVALRELWLLGTEGMFRLSELSRDEFQREELRGALADLLSTITNPRRLAISAIKFEEDGKAFLRSDEVEDSVNHLYDNLDSVFWEAIVSENYDHEAAAKSLNTALRREPERTVLAMRELDIDLIKNFNPSHLHQDLKFEYLDEDARKYGVTRGLSTGARELLSVTFPVVESTLQKIAASGSLARGRPDKGIFSLVEDFIKAEQIRRRCSGQICERERKAADIAREELSQGLIHFAQKVSSIANHDALLPNAGDFDSPDEKGGNLKFRSNNARFRSAFVPTLQAIGNTFLIQADELEARRRHTKKLNERLDPEIHALKASLSRPPVRVIDDLLLDLTVRHDAVKAGKSSGFAALPSTRDALQKEEAKLEAEEKKLAELQSELTALKTSITTVNGKAGPAIFAHRTVTGSQQTPLNETFDTGETSAELINDKNALRTHLEADGSKISIDDLKKRAVSWFQGQILAKFPDTPRQKRLSAGLAFFLSELGGLSGATAIDRDEAIDQLEKEVVRIYRAALSSVRAATTARDSKQQEVTDSEAAIKILKATIKRLIAEEVTRLSDTITVIEERRDDIQVEADRRGEAGDPPTPMRLLKEKVKQDLAAQTGDTKLSNAKTILALYPRPSGQAEVEALYDRRHNGDRRDALDDLISSLRYADIEAERSGQGARTAHLQAALKKAYEYRASMVYIRPASSYLRSSYAANSLQGDPTLGWRNMLSRHASRGLPHFIAQAINQDDPNTEAIRAELDKQFWQNINSVRVGGGGITNYALIKDDIGNWSIKSYSADPEPIIKAAQSLAMFNLGGSLDTNLLRVNELRSKPNRSDGEQEELNLLTERTAGGGPALKRLFEHHEQRYVEKTDTQLKAFAAEVKGTTLQDRVKAAWTQSLQGEADDEAFRQSLLALPDSDDAINEANKTLAEAGSLTALAADDDAKELKKKRQERQKTAITMGEKMVAALGQVNGYRTKLQSEAGLIIGKKIEENRGKIAGTSTEIQSIEKMIAEQETTEKNLVKAIADLKGLRPTDTGPEQQAFDSKLEELDSNLQAIRTELATNRTRLTTQKSTLSEAKTKLALREIQLKAISADANRIVGGLILEITRGRQVAMASFEQAILFIGDTPDASGDPLLRLGQPQ